MSRPRLPASLLPAVDAVIDRPQPGGGAVPVGYGPDPQPVEDVMTLRLHGTPAECAAATERLRRTPGLHITDQSRRYPDHAGELVASTSPSTSTPPATTSPASPPVAGEGGDGSGCFECATDHHLACPLLGEEDDGFDPDEDGWYSVHCCCGLAVDSRQTLDAEYTEYAEELRHRGWSQPTGPGHHLGEGSG